MDFDARLLGQRKLRTQNSEIGWDDHKIVSSQQLDFLCWWDVIFTLSRAPESAILVIRTESCDVHYFLYVHLSLILPNKFLSSEFWVLSSNCSIEYRLLQLLLFHHRVSQEQFGITFLGAFVIDKASLLTVSMYITTRCRPGSTLAHVMACGLTGSSHYLNQCWFIISEVSQNHIGKFHKRYLSHLSLKSTWKLLIYNFIQISWGPIYWLIEAERRIYVSVI